MTLVLNLRAMSDERSLEGAGAANLIGQSLLEGFKVVLHSLAKYVELGQKVLQSRELDSQLAFGEHDPRGQGSQAGAVAPTIDRDLDLTCGVFAFRLLVDGSHSLPALLLPLKLLALLQRDMRTQARRSFTRKMRSKAWRSRKGTVSRARSSATICVSRGNQV